MAHDCLTHAVAGACVHRNALPDISAADLRYVLAHMSEVSLTRTHSCGGVMFVWFCR